MNTEPAALLVVEDNPVTGGLLSRWLRDRGHTVTLCTDGKRAQELVAENVFDLVLLDVGVPGADGFEVLRAVRQNHPPTALPIVMATAHGQSELVVRALELGANDYVTKPYDPPVLMARIQTQLAVKRMVEQKDRLERNLAERNGQLEEANQRMKAGLRAAAKVQEALLPPAGMTIPGLRMAWSFLPCEDLAGDTLNVFPLGRDHAALFVLDVAGHGVPAALLSVHLSLILSPVRGPSSFLLRDGQPVGPAEVVGALNRLFADGATERYFTLFYGVFHRQSGELRYTCAGHPGPLHVSAEACDFLPPSGPPVGIMEMEYEELSRRMEPGDRLYLYSDGVTEAGSSGKQMYGKARLAALMLRQRAVSLEDSLAALMTDVDAWAGGRADDDVSALAVEFTGAATPSATATS